MPTLGKTSVGATPGPLNANQQYANGPYTATENGTITSISLHATTVGGTPLARFGVWLDNGADYPGVLVAESSAGTPVVGLNTFAASGSIVSGQSYYIGYLSNQSLTNPYDAGTKEIVLRNQTFGALTDPYGAGGTEVGSRDYTMYLTYDATSTPSLAVNASAWELRGMGPSKPATMSMALTGTASDFTGPIEASFNGSAYATIATIVGNGAWSGSLTVSPGRGNLIVREVLTPANSVTVANFGVGDLYLVSGDSNSEGRLTNSQSHGLGSNQPSAYRQDDAWVEANDPTDTGTIGGSHWPLLARLLTEETGRPVGFVTTGTGSTDIAGNSTFYAKPNAGYIIIQNQTSETAKNFAGMLLHTGPNAAIGNTLTQAQYVTALELFAENIRADIQTPLPIYLGAHGRSSTTTAGNPTIRRAQAQVATGTRFTGGPNYIEQNWTDGVHPKTDAEAITAASRWFAALTGVRAPRVTSATITATGLLLNVDQPLNTAVSTYATAIFAIGATNPTAAARVGTNQIALTFAVVPSVGDVLTIFPAETAITAGTANIPTSPVVTLPVTIHSVSSVVQPLDPVLVTCSVLTGGAYVFDQLLDDAGDAVTTGAAISVRADNVTAAGIGVLIHLGGGVWEYLAEENEIPASGQATLILSHASYTPRQVIRVTNDVSDALANLVLTAENFSTSALAIINKHRRS